MKRAAWRAGTAAADPADLVFLDETSTPTTLAPTRARAPRGQRAVGAVPRTYAAAVTAADARGFYSHLGYALPEPPGQPS